MVLYDFGCLKRVPERIACGYARLLLAACEDHRAVIPEVLAEIGLVKADGAPLDLELIEPYIDLFAEILRHSYWARQGDLEDVLTRAQRLSPEYAGDAEVAELVSLIGKAARLTGPVADPDPDPDRERTVVDPTEGSL